MKPWILLLLAGLLLLSAQLTTAKILKPPPKVKPGECPKIKILAKHPCHQHCLWDSNCEGNKKCCPVGCAKECFLPG